MNTEKSELEAKGNGVLADVMLSFLLFVKKYQFHEYAQLWHNKNLDPQCVYGKTDEELITEFKSKNGA